MAEFHKVVRQLKRMCFAHKTCTDCALYGNECPIIRQPSTWNVNALVEIERLVMDWAAANPEPRYPTWTEWLREFSRAGIDLHSTIPADIAEKLGIKPIGGKNDGNA